VTALSIAAPFGVGFLIAIVYLFTTRRRLAAAYPPPGVPAGGSHVNFIVTAIGRPPTRGSLP
jgi:hypothetical protein